MTVEDFAKKINTTRRNAYKVFEKNTIDTGILIKISKVLGENLFLKYISETEIVKSKITVIKSEEVLPLLLDMKKSIEELKSQKKSVKKAKK